MEKGISDETSYVEFIIRWFCKHNFHKKWILWMSLHIGRIVVEMSAAFLWITRKIFSKWLLLKFQEKLCENYFWETTPYRALMLTFIQKNLLQFENRDLKKIWLRICVRMYFKLTSVLG